MIAVVIGTRPELIKMAPVVRELERRQIARCTIFTGQHRELLTDTAAALGISPDIAHQPAGPAARLSALLTGQLTSLDQLLEQRRPAAILAQGDTSAAMAAAMAALYHKIPLGHVEAGLRAEGLWSPHPEEGHRRAISALATWHFAPTERARDALLAEGIDAARVVVTGNTAIDALREVVEAGQASAPGWVGALGQAPIVVTMHRRENVGAGVAGVIEAVRQLAPLRPVIWPLHPNPAVAGPVRAMLSRVAGVTLCEPLPYPELIGLLKRAALVITDSGGLQEEAPALGVMTLVARDQTERVEGIEAGLARLVGCEPGRIVQAALSALEQPGSRPGDGALLATPYGDGHAARRIVDVVAGVG